VESIREISALTRPANGDCFPNRRPGANLTIRFAVVRIKARPATVDAYIDRPRDRSLTDGRESIAGQHNADKVRRMEKPKAVHFAVVGSERMGMQSGKDYLSMCCAMVCQQDHPSGDYLNTSRAV